MYVSSFAEGSPCAGLKAWFEDDDPAHQSHDSNDQTEVARPTSSGTPHHQMHLSYSQLEHQRNAAQLCNQQLGTDTVDQAWQTEHQSSQHMYYQHMLQDQHYAEEEQMMTMSQDRACVTEGLHQQGSMPEGYISEQRHEIYQDQYYEQDGSQAYLQPEQENQALNGQVTSGVSRNCQCRDIQYAACGAQVAAQDVYITSVETASNTPHCNSCQGVLNMLIVALSILRVPAP